MKPENVEATAEGIVGRRGGASFDIPAELLVNHSPELIRSSYADSRGARSGERICSKKGRSSRTTHHMRELTRVKFTDKGGQGVSRKGRAWTPLDGGR